MLDNFDLLDLGYFGNKYTWQRPSVGGRLISRWLDRVLGNQSWRVLFLETTLEVLTRLHSDHNPILLRCGPIQHRRGVCVKSDKVISVRF
uniref:Endonuclease/exonuclease/phosphatase domain-containing protein n=1 Tax=Cajanus cajan TaxID=3821 RepID=A0A151R689_CAJCA|nr:hypothetical protein KK1_040696 [Cajanus cajan]